VVVVEGGGYITPPKRTFIFNNHLINNRLNLSRRPILPGGRPGDAGIRSG
jgi:hypothetical protein